MFSNCIKYNSFSVVNSMFISIKDVCRDGLANAINLFAFLTVTTKHLKCSKCGDYEHFITCEYKPKAWSFIFDEENKISSSVYCSRCGHLERNYQTNAKISIDLPISKDDEVRFEQILDELMKCGGIWLPVDDDNEQIIADVEAYVNKEGLTTKKRIKPIKINYNMFYGFSPRMYREYNTFSFRKCLLACVSDNYLYTKELTNKVVDYIYKRENIPDDFDEYFKEFYIEIRSNIEMELNIRLCEFYYQIDCPPPTNLVNKLITEELLKEIKSNCFKDEYENSDSYESWDNESDEEFIQTLDYVKISYCITHFLKSFCDKYGNQYLKKPVPKYIYCDIAALAMYNLSDWN